MTDPVDQLAREMYSAALVVDGFSEHTADAMSARQVPEHYYADAERMAARFNSTEGGDRDCA